MTDLLPPRRNAPTGTAPHRQLAHRSRRARPLALGAALVALLAVTACEPVSPTPTTTTTAPPTTPARRAVGYYSSWSIYERNYQVAAIPAAKLTHVNYAFADVRDGGCVLGDPWADVQKPFPGDPAAAPFKGNLRQLQLLKAQHPHLKTLIAVGGASSSGGFSAAAATDASRRGFATSCADFVQRYGLDGIDIDWEYPVGGGAAGGRPEDERNLTLLMRALRQELDVRGTAAGRRYLLSAATPASAWHLDNFEIDQVAAAADFLNVMTYDYHGSWEQITGLNAPIASAPGDPTPSLTASATVDLYRARGVPAAKINLGIPFYGRGWSGVGSAGNGLFQPASGVPMGPSEPGLWNYRDLLADEIATMPRYRSTVAQVPYLYDPATGIFITYDDPTSVRAKAAFARSRGLGGVMVWELGGDDDQHRLLDAATS